MCKTNQSDGMMHLRALRSVDFTYLCFGISRLACFSCVLYYNRGSQKRNFGEMENHVLALCSLIQVRPRSIVVVATSCSRWREGLTLYQLSSVRDLLFCCSCDFSWYPGNWEQCSATCGQEGMQERQLYCVPANAR